MARKPMVTRTIPVTKCKVLCCDIEAGDTYIEEVTVPRTYKTDAQLMKVMKLVLESKQIKPVHIVEKVVKETLFGMTELEFINHATVLPARPK